MKPPVVKVKKRRKVRIPAEVAKERIKERTRPGPPADSTPPPKDAQIDVIRHAKDCLGDRMTESHGAYWLDGKVISLGDMLREANAVLVSQGKPALGKHHARWGQ